MDAEVAKQFQRMLQKQGIEFRLGTKVTAADPNGEGPLKVTMEPAKGGAKETLDADVVLLSIGRAPHTEGLGLEKAGVKVENKRRIVTDEHFRTNVAGIYAIGDVSRGRCSRTRPRTKAWPWRKSSGQERPRELRCDPRRGLHLPRSGQCRQDGRRTERAGIAYKVGKFPFTANGRAEGEPATDGFVKVLADAKTDRVLGVHISAPDAGNMIAKRRC